MPLLHSFPYLHSSKVRYKVIYSTHSISFNCNLHSSKVRYKDQDVIEEIKDIKYLHSSKVRYKAPYDIRATDKQNNLHSSKVRYKETSSSFLKPVGI